MAQGELPVELAEEIRRRVFVEEGFMKAVQVLRRGGSLFRVSLRPVSIKGERKFQGEMSDTRDNSRPLIKNFSEEEASAGLEEMLSQTGPREFHLVTASGDLHIRVTKKGKALVSRSAPLKRDAPELAHDRAKDVPLARFDSAFLLRVLGIADKEGKIMPSMRGKFDQVNAFINVVDTILPSFAEKKIAIADCGCGRSYLTLALVAYLRQVHGFDAQICGIDRRADVVATSRRLAQDLDLADCATFLESDIASATLPFSPDLTVSLHACDTATDEAIARGSEWHSRHILCAPCYQHELHKALGNGGPLAALLRHGILRERFADLLTDTFRAQILRILGYRTNVQEFVSREATARNILLRAEWGVKPGQSQSVDEYLRLRDFWKVTPWLETRLGEKLAKYLSRYE